MIVRLLRTFALFSFVFLTFYNCSAQSCGGIRSTRLSFNVAEVSISETLRNELTTLADEMRHNPGCKVVVSGNGGGSKIEQQRSWDRTYTIIDHMNDSQGIDRNRFIFNYGGEGAVNTVDIRAAAEGEEGASTRPAPFPNMSRL